MKLKIYQPTKSAMQSGKKNTKKWLVAPIEEKNTRFLDNLMEWVSSNDTKTQLRFEFTTKEEAIEYAKSQGFEYEIHQPNISNLKKKSYAENFTN